MTTLIHAGVKGMKWGVRKEDDALLSRVVGYKSTSETSEDRARYKEYKNTTSKSQRRLDKRDVLTARINYVIEDSLSKPLNFVVAGTIGAQTLMSGKEFVEKMGMGMAINPMATYVTDLKQNNT